VNIAVSRNMHTQQRQTKCGCHQLWIHCRWMFWLVLELNSKLFFSFSKTYQGLFRVF